MEPPAKRPKLDYYGLGDEEEDEDEISMDPAQFDATQDPMYQLDKGRAKAVTRLKSAFEDIFEKYGQDFSGDDDVINFYTDEIEVDNGHVQSLTEKKKKDGDTGGSDSSDEEEITLSGKSGGRGATSPSKSRSKSKSLTLANRTKPNQVPRLQSQWNGFPGMCTYRLSSLAFAASPYVTPPPFEFTPSPYGSSHIDPVWQAPDLPLQLPSHHQPRSLTGAWGSQTGSFGGQPHPAVKRLVTAKSFLLHAASTSSKTDDDDVEEDDLTPNKPDSLGKEVTPAKTTKLATAGIVSTQHHKSADPQTSPPKAHKRTRSKKSDARESTIALEKVPERGPRALRPSERRIEIIIPTMKRFLPTEPRPAADETSSLIGGNPPELEMQDRLLLGEDTGNTHWKNGRRKSRSTGGREDEVRDQESPDLADSSGGIVPKHMVQVDEDTEHASTLSQPRNTRRRRSRRKPAPTELSSKDASPHDEHCLEHAYVEATQELGSPKVTTDNDTADDVCTSLHEIVQNLSCDDESDEVVSCPHLSPITITDVDETQATNSTNMGENVGESTKEILVDNDSPVAVSAPLTDELSNPNVDSFVETSDPATTEANVPETAISLELGATPCENEVSPQDELDYPLTNTFEEEMLSIYSQASDKMTAHHLDLHLEDVFSSSQIPNTQDTHNTTPSPVIEFQSLKFSAIRDTVESDLFTDQDHLPPVFGASQIHEDQEHDASQPSFLSSELAADIDDLQLDSDYRDTQQSPTLGALELPDEDLSIFPLSCDAHPTSELVLRVSSSTKQSDTQRDVGTGRSPSPQLGTPTGPEIIQRTASRTKSTPAPTTPTKSRGPRSTKPRSGHHHSPPSSRRSTLSSLIPQDIDDESDDELSLAGSFSSTTRSRFNSPFFRANNTTESPQLPPLLTTPRKRNRKSSLLSSSPLSVRTPKNQILGSSRHKNIPPATDSRTTSRSQSRQGRGRGPRAAHSSPTLARTVAERLLSSPTKKPRAAPQMTSPGLVLSPHGTLRRCDESGFACERAFCLTCCK
ncbi:hypothetical protein F5B17DRAFT_206948 [Nemania serpens]|nr:hypothetical protein F5B17DRAFT_206948 [Nemania serpens]